MTCPIKSSALSLFCPQRKPERLVGSYDSTVLKLPIDGQLLCVTLLSACMYVCVCVCVLDELQLDEVNDNALRG